MSIEIKSELIVEQVARESVWPAASFLWNRDMSLVKSLVSLEFRKFRFRLAKLFQKMLFRLRSSVQKETFINVYSRTLHRKQLLQRLFPTLIVKRLRSHQFYTPQFIALFPLVTFACCVGLAFDIVRTKTW